MESLNITIALVDAAIQFYGTEGDGHCLFRALAEEYGKPLSLEEVYVLRRLISERVREMSDRHFENELSVAATILASSGEDVEVYCEKMASTDAHGGPLEIKAYVEKRCGAVSVRVWTEAFLDDEKVLREMAHYRGKANAPVIELLWCDGGDAAADQEVADHYERFDWLGVRQPPLSTPRSFSCSSTLLPLLFPSATLSCHSP